MIRFPCICGHPFELPEDQAGTSLQCPNCGLLVDVPTVTELAALGEDGTYKVDSAVKHDPEALEKMILAFSQDREDHFWRVKDLRQTHESLEHIGEPEELELADQVAGKAPPPKYDPITGELIRELEVKQEVLHVEPDAVPTARALVAYAGPRTEQHFSGVRIIPELFNFANMVVIGIIFMAHIFLQVMLFPVMAGLFLIVFPLMLLVALMLSHYAVVVNEIATNDKDELPRPLRDFGWHEDLWGPFVHFFGSLMICYGPIVAINWMPDVRAIIWAYVMAVMIVGTLAFPAIFLTMTTSGSFINLSPDRLLSVIRELGAKYALCVALWVAAAGMYVLGFVGTMLAMLKLFVVPGSLPWYVSPPIAIAYPVLFAAIVMMHGFCWYLWLQYRYHQPAFGWAFQSHIRRDELPHRGYAIPSAKQLADANRRVRAATAIPIVKEQTDPHI